MGGRRGKEEMTHMKILMSKPLALLPSPGQRQKWPGDLSDIPVVVVSLARTATYEKKLKKSRSETFGRGNCFGLK